MTVWSNIIDVLFGLIIQLVLAEVENDLLAKINQWLHRRLNFYMKINFINT